MNSFNLKNNQRAYNFLRLVKRRSIELSYYLASGLKKLNEPNKKFVIYGQGRTGSELLCSLLDSHPKIQCDKEILAHHVFFPKLFIKGKYLACNQDAYGFKVKIYQLQDVQKLEPRKFMTELLNDDWKIVHIKRNNILRQAISWQVAEQRKQYHVKSKNQKLSTEKVTIDCNLLLEHMKYREMYQKTDEKVLENLPYLTVVYEEDLLPESKHQATVDKICDYLNIASVLVKTNFVRLTPDKLSELIENYEEFVNVIAQSKYAKFLTVDKY